MPKKRLCHIAFISPHCDPEANLGEPDAGGQCVYEHQLALALTRLTKNIHITTYCRQNGHRPSTTQPSSQYTIKRIRSGRDGFVRKEDIEGTLHEFTSRILFDIKETENLILHGHYWDGGKSALMFKALASQPIPLVWTPHSLGTLKRTHFKKRENESVYNFVPRLVWENYISLAAKRVIVSSSSELDLLENEYALDTSRAEIIPPGIDTCHFTPRSARQARKALKLPQDTYLLITAGRLEPTKGFEHALVAAAIFKKICSVPFELHIYAGSRNKLTPQEKKYQESLRKVVQEHGLHESVIFHRSVDYSQMNDVYAAADVFLMLSHNEPFGLTMLEAMSSQTATIASHTSGATSFIKHNQNGILVNVSKPAIIATYLRALALDKEYRTTMGYNARKTIMDSISWETQAQKFLNAYMRILDENEPFDFNDWVKNNYFITHNLLSR